MRDFALVFVEIFAGKVADAVDRETESRLQADDIQYQFDFFDCRIVIYQQSFSGMIDALRPSLPGVKAK